MNLDYEINPKPFAAMIVVLALISGFLYFSSTSDFSENTRNVNISLMEDTSPEELTRVTVTNDNNTLEKAKIFIGDDYIGETNSYGNKAFEAPEGDSFNLTVEYSNQSTTATFYFQNQNIAYQNEVK